MKKFSIIFLLFLFFGCSLSPFKEKISEISPNQNKITIIFQEELKNCFNKIKKIVMDTNENIKYESINSEEAIIETKDFKILLIKIKEKTIEVVIKGKNKEKTNYLAKIINLEINSVGYDKQGKPIN